jgi:hypothetical protein
MEKEEISQDTQPIFSRMTWVPLGNKLSPQLLATWTSTISTPYLTTITTEFWLAVTEEKEPWLYK